ncbi:hypothetical protein DF268_07285 [Streptomyces sp. V2]|uniref:hypothetical protein n=1 Tax=Streptomyces TaxID=1883 RepID=UPI0006EB6A72|nr:MULTISPECIES: hypothetical protein [Streptomyces]PWG14341.1 hypothetical protein DF268_07285 [Streptomyces sp. V2]
MVHTRAHKLDVPRRHYGGVGRDWAEISKAVIYSRDALRSGDLGHFVPETADHAVFDLGAVITSLPPQRSDRGGSRSTPSWPPRCLAELG